MAPGSSIGRNTPRRWSRASRLGSRSCCGPKPKRRLGRELVAAEDLAAEGYSLAEDSGSLGAIAFMSAARGLVHAYRRRIDAGQCDAERAVELARKLEMPLLATMAAQAFGIAALSVGDARGAHERLDPFAQIALANGVGEPALCRFLPDEIEALTRLGEFSIAEALLGPFQARSAQLGRTWGIATADRCRGLLLAPRGDLADGEAALAMGLRRNSAWRCLSKMHGRFWPPGSSPATTAQAQGTWRCSRLRWRSSNG